MLNREKGKYYLIKSNHLSRLKSNDANGFDAFVKISHISTKKSSASNFEKSGASETLIN